MEIIFLSKFSIESANLVQYLLSNEHMQALFNDVFDNYFSTRTKLGGVAKIVNSPDQDALLQKIPDLFVKYLKSRNIFPLYKVKGSIGNGNIARVPWVGLFRNEITENAENGYYIVLLFSEDMSSCFLSLNQGITAIENIYTKKFALKKMRESAKNAVGFLDSDPEAWPGPINLKSTGDLGRGYEAAAILSFQYIRTNPPSVQQFFSHLDHLLINYDRLFQRFGKDLYSLFNVSENEFQQVVMEKAAQQADSKLMPGVSESIDSIDHSLLSKGNLRSPLVAAEAIRAAQFCCEIDATHRSFVSRAKGQQYVEAHHLIPMSQQEGFFVPLDVVANVVALCATCHRMLHYGIEEDRRFILISLLRQRRKRLKEKSIEIKANDFLRFYSSKAVLEE